MKKQTVYFVLIQVAFLCSAQQKPLFDITTKYDAKGEASFQQVKELILEHYYYNGLSTDDLYWAAIKGMLTHISPPETPNLAALWTDEEYEQILNSLKGQQVSLGFNSTFNSNDGSLTVTAITEGSGAEGKLQPLDRILRIDNQELKGKSLDEINQLLDGPIGSEARLKAIRDITIFDVYLTRDTLKTENLIVTTIPGKNIALIEVKSVTVGIANQLKGELEKLKASGVQSIILDFRNNSGGVLNEGVNISKLFMNEGDIVLRTQSSAKGILNYVASEHGFTDFNIAALINENTASSSEIVVSALRDHNRAIIIGKKTFGKGVIETTYTLENNYRVKFITNAMYSPKGISWQTVGLLPDFFVDQSQDAYNQIVKSSIENRMRSDLHLTTAIKLLEQ